MSDMKILTLDIETAPHHGYFWGIWQQNIGLNMLAGVTRMLSWAAKWYGSDEVLFANENSHGTRDMVLEIYDLVNAADVIVGYNSIQFDMKHLNREFIEQGLMPPTPYKNIDLLAVVKKNFKFPSNKLDYVAGVLLGRHKLKHAGFQLWLDCMDGNKKAWEMMMDYNIEDVLITEELYTHLRGWISGHPNHGLYVVDQDNLVCRNCGSTHINSKGPEFTTTNVFAYQRYKCMDCGANMRGRNSIKGGRKHSPQVVI